jgi:hypothetical protein
VENCKVDLLLAYRSIRRHALIGRQSHPPASWTEVRDRCRAAGITDEVDFATKVRVEATASSLGGSEWFFEFTGDSAKAPSMPTH